MPPRPIAFGAACLVAIAVLAGCVRSTAGSAVRAGEPATSATTHSSATRQPTTSPGTPVPGIETTLPDHIPPNAFVCFPEPAGVGVSTVAQVSDPAAPRITVALPDEWTSEPGENEVALTLSGPDGMTGIVTIAATNLDPAAAFADRIAHIWTNTTNYLVTIHLEGPPDAPGFDAAKTALMQDFAVVIP
jgi:hypothetical protein